MICGIGCDITDVSRMKKWVRDEKMIRYVFNEQEIVDSGKYSSEQKLCEHYAARFAAKEAFSKALGTGLCGFSVKNVFITNGDEGEPILHIESKAKDILEKKFGKCNVHVSLSHEKNSAIAFVVIEKAEGEDKC